MRGLRLAVAIGAAIAISGLAIGIAVGSIPGADGTISGCYNKNNGTLRVIDAPSVACTSSEIAISWNQTGPQGPAGLKGDPGAPGPAGPPGPPGSSIPERPTIGTFSATGQTQGTIATNVPFVSFDWSVVSPRDAATGLPTGRRQHKPLVLTMAADAASVRLLHSIFTNENLPSVDLSFMHEGETEPYLLIELEDAGLASIEQSTEGGQELEHITFVYERITVTWVSPSVIVQDDWAAPDA